MPKFFNKKTATVRFHGFNEEKKYQNSKSDIIVSKRLIELIAVTLVLIFILIVRLAYVQLTQADIIVSETFLGLLRIFLHAQS